MHEKLVLSVKLALKNGFAQLLQREILVSSSLLFSAHLEWFLVHREVLGKYLVNLVTSSCVFSSLSFQFLFFKNKLFFFLIKNSFIFTEKLQR